MVSLSRRRAIVACVCAAGAALAAPSAEARTAEQHLVQETDAFVPASKLPRAEPQRTYLKLYDRANKRGSDPGPNILVGGSGDPAAAPEAEQDAGAAALLARDGAGHWPVCGG